MDHYSHVDKAYQCECHGCIGFVHGETIRCLNHVRRPGMKCRTCARTKCGNQDEGANEDYDGYFERWEGADYNTTWPYVVSMDDRMPGLLL